MDNIASRDFHANQPYKKLLAHITKFTLPYEKLYLSTMIDCFDKMVVGWTIGSRLNTNLVNTMLEKVITDLPDGCHSAVHSDGGYR